MGGVRHLESLDRMQESAGTNSCTLALGASSLANSQDLLFLTATEGNKNPLGFGQWQGHPTPFLWPARKPCVLQPGTRLGYSAHDGFQAARFIQTGLQETQTIQAATIPSGD